MQTVACANFLAYNLSQQPLENYLSQPQAIVWCYKLGLDVLVHGEAERNDMVEYFGEQLDGYAFTGHGWVQSYGSRCVKPPIIFGDVSRPRPMTVTWSAFAQSFLRPLLQEPKNMIPVLKAIHGGGKATVEEIFFASCCSFHRPCLSLVCRS